MPRACWCDRRNSSQRTEAVALAVVVEGQAVEVTEPRVCRMIMALVRREDKIRRIEQGRLELHFGQPTQKVRVKVTDDDCE